MENSMKVQPCLFLRSVWSAWSCELPVSAAQPPVISSRSSRSTECMWINGCPGTHNLCGSTVFYCSGPVLCPQVFCCVFCKVILFFSWTSEFRLWTCSNLHSTGFTSLEANIKPVTDVKTAGLQQHICYSYKMSFPCTPSSTVMYLQQDTLVSLSPALFA